MRKTRTWLNIFLMMLLLCAGISLRVSASGENEAEEKQVVRVGYTPYGQMIQKSEQGFTGYGVEYLQRIAEYTGWQYEYVFVTEKDRKQALRDGEIDLLCDISNEENANENLLLSSANSGMYYALLCARKEDNTVFFDDFDAMQGKRIALNTRKAMIRMFEDFCEENGIEFIPVYCSSFEDMEKALENGKADLMVTSNQRELSKYKYVAKIGMQNQYFATSVGNSALLEQIDEADYHIKLQQPFIQGALYEKYYGLPSKNLNGTTREEYEFINSGQPVRVACDANSYPMEYTDETGNFKGIYADAMRLLEQESGLTFEYVPLQDFKQAWDLLASGEVDMAAKMFMNEKMAAHYGILYSDTYLEADFTMICRGNELLPDKPKIAIPEKYVGVRFYVAEKYPEWDVTLCKDVAEGFDLVEQKQADGTIVNDIYLQTIFNLNHYDNLVVMPRHNMEIPVSCGIGGENAEIIRSILNKAISHIPAEQFERCVVENAINVFYEPTFSDIFEKILPALIVITVFVATAFVLSLKARERHYRHLAMTDPVTGLWNGTKFRKEAAELLNHIGQKEYQMISLDIERFKYVSNDFSERAADSILQIIGRRIRMQFEGTALYARDMADRFLVLAEKHEDNEERFTSISEEIVFENNGREQRYKPVIKFGISQICGQEEGTTLGEYIDHAIIARKSIKGSLNKRIAFYNQEMADMLLNEHKIELRMEDALKNHEFVVYYQPKFQLKDETIIGAEALVRWMDPNEGMISPGEFIPLFERNGFIVQLDFYVYEEVLKSMARWQSEGRNPLVVSFNVSRAHIDTEDFLHNLIALAEQYGVPRSMLELELTETVLGGKREKILAFIMSCKEAGFQISIDDFGSGYSSLNLLKELPVDVLKIDREFLNEAETSEKSSIIIEKVVEMATKIQIHTLCEGVETRSQADFLKQIGCDMAQGFLYSRPLPVGDFEKMLG